MSAVTPERLSRRRGPRRTRDPGGRTGRDAGFEVGHQPGVAARGTLSGSSTLLAPLRARDTLLMAEALRRLGTEVAGRRGSDWVVTGRAGAG